MKKNMVSADWIKPVVSLLLICMVLVAGFWNNAEAAQYTLFEQKWDDNTEGMAVELESASLISGEQIINYSVNGSAQVLVKVPYEGNPIFSNVLGYNDLYYFVVYMGKGEGAVYSLTKNGNCEKIHTYTEKDASLMKKYEPFGGELKITGMNGSSMTYTTFYWWDDEGQKAEYTYDLGSEGDGDSSAETGWKMDVAVETELSDWEDSDYGNPQYNYAVLSWTLSNDGAPYEDPYDVIIYRKNYASSKQALSQKVYKELDQENSSGSYSDYDHTLSWGAWYAYKVEAVSSEGEAFASGESIIYTGPKKLTIDIPASQEKKYRTGKKITFEIVEADKDNPGMTPQGYIVYRKDVTKKEKNFKEIADKPFIGPMTVYTDKTVKANHTYSYKVRPYLSREEYDWDADTYDEVKTYGKYSNALKKSAVNGVPKLTMTITDKWNAKRGSITVRVKSDTGNGNIVFQSKGYSGVSEKRYSKGEFDKRIDIASYSTNGKKWIKNKKSVTLKPGKTIWLRMQIPTSVRKTIKNKSNLGFVDLKLYKYDGQSCMVYKDDADHTLGKIFAGHYIRVNLKKNKTAVVTAGR